MKGGLAGGYMSGEDWIRADVSFIWFEDDGINYVVINTLQETLLKTHSELEKKDTHNPHSQTEPPLWHHWEKCF